MEERNELNDIILNRSNDSLGSNKKILLAVAVLAVILIAVVMIMKTSASNSTENLPQVQQAAKTNLPPEPPVVQAGDDQNQSGAPLFQPVEIVKENKKADDDLDKIAQKLKQESLSKETTAPDAAPVTSTAKNEATVTPAVKQNQHVVKENALKNEPQTKPEPVVKQEFPAKKESISKKEPSVKKESLFTKESISKKEVTPTKESTSKKESLFAKESTSKKDLPLAKENTLKKEPKKAANTSPSGNYYVQVGSFTKVTPGEKFFGSIKKLGYENESIKVGETSKIMVGPFKSELDARDALKALRKDVEPGAFITKK